VIPKRMVLVGGGLERGGESGKEDTGGRGRQVRGKVVGGGREVMKKRRG